MKQTIGRFIVVLLIVSTYSSAASIDESDSPVVTAKAPLTGPPAEAWRTLLGGSAYDIVYQAQETDDGFLLIGTTDSYGQGKRDYFLIKIDTQGKELWNTTYGGALDDVGHNIIPAVDGGFLLAGVSTSYGAGKYDMCVIKINDVGDQEWMRLYGASKIDICESIVQTESTGYILVGYTNSFGNGDYDMWMMHIDSQGNILWDKRVGGPLDEMAREIKKTPHGEYIVLGTNTNQSIVITINGNGDILSERRIQYNETPTFLNNVEILDNEGYVLSGYHVPSTSIQTPIALHIDTEGTLLWSQTYVPEGTMGSFWTALHTSTNGFLFGGYKQCNDTNSAWVVKTNAKGELTWEHIYYHTGMIEGMIQTRDDGFLILSRAEEDSEVNIGVVKLGAEACPDTPLIPSGRAQGHNGTGYRYTTSTSHPSSDAIWYQWDWGDETQSEWLGPYASGAPCEAAHTWVTSGTYRIQVKAKDSADCESDWSDPFIVSMPLVRYPHFVVTLSWNGFRFPAFLDAL